MSAPAYNKSLSPIKNLQALLRALGATNIANTLESAVAQLLHRIHTTALALDGTLTVLGNFVIGASKFTVGAATGNTAIGGTLSVTGQTALAGGLVSATMQTLTGAGAVNLTALTTLLVTTAADALTLADGANGQIKNIVMITDGGDGTLTPTSKTGYSTITFNDAGDSVMLQFVTGKGWIILANTGCTVA
jgi:hypothetical protein